MPGTPSILNVVPPATMTLDDLEHEALRVGEAARAVTLDKKTVLTAIHDGKLPAFWPGGNSMLGFRVHRKDLEAWYFNDPTLAHTPGTGSPEGPRR